MKKELLTSHLCLRTLIYKHLSTNMSVHYLKHFINTYGVDVKANFLIRS